MATETAQMKVSGIMGSFCTMSIEQALKRHHGVNSVLVNLVYGALLAEADMAKISRGSLLQGLASTRRCHYEYCNNR